MVKRRSILVVFLGSVHVLCLTYAQTSFGTFYAVECLEIKWNRFPHQRPVESRTFRSR